MKSRELGPEHSTQSVARYASACGLRNPACVKHYQDIIPTLHWSDPTQYIVWKAWCSNSTLQHAVHSMHTKFEVIISIQDRVIAQNRFRPYMAVSQPSWIRRLWPKSHRFLFWGATKQNLESISQPSAELCLKIGFDHVWQWVGHLESGDLKKITQLFILRYLI